MKKEWWAYIKHNGYERLVAGVDCETEEEALEQFKHRKLRQIKILNGQLDFARIALHHVGVRFKETQYEIIIEKW